MFTPYELFSGVYFGLSDGGASSSARNESDPLRAILRATCPDDDQKPNSTFVALGRVVKYPLDKKEVK